MKTVWLLIVIGLAIGLSSSKPARSERGDVLADPALTRCLFVYNFTKHIEWPAHSRNVEQFRIAVIGPPEIAVHLEKLFEGREVSGQRVVVERLNASQRPVDIQVVYVTEGYEDYLWRWKAKDGNQSVLWITETGTSARQYSGINIITSGKKVQFQINEALLKQKQLKVSGQLLELAVSE